MAIELKKLNKNEALELANKLKNQSPNQATLDQTDENINLLVAGLADERGLIRRTFSEALGAIGKPALPALLRALNDDSSVIRRRAAAKTLKLVGDPSALQGLLKALANDPDPVVQGSAAGAMAIFGAEAAKLLLEVLNNPKSTEMQCGLVSWALAFIGSEASETLLKAANHNAPKVRAAAIAALGEKIKSLSNQASKEILIKALKDKSNDVRLQAIKLIGTLDKVKWAEEILITLLFDKDNDIRKGCALSLMQLNSLQSIKILKDLESKEESKDVLLVLQLAIRNLSKG